MTQDITLDVFWQSVRNVERKAEKLETKLTHMDGIMIDPVEFGQLKAEVAAQRRDLDRLVATIEHLAKSMDDVRDTLTEARGGWRAVAMISGVAATLGAAISWVVQHVKIS